MNKVKKIYIFENNTFEMSTVDIPIFKDKPIEVLDSDLPEDEFLKILREKNNYAFNTETKKFAKIIKKKEE